MFSVKTGERFEGLTKKGHEVARTVRIAYGFGGTQLVMLETERYDEFHGWVSHKVETLYSGESIEEAFRVFTWSCEIVAKGKRPNKDCMPIGAMLVSDYTDDMPL